MTIRWPWQRWRRYDLLVDGARFRAWVTPVRREVEWLDCPSDGLPSGYSSRALVAGTRSRVRGWWELRRLPVPTRAEMESEVREWLRTLSTYGDETGAGVGD